MRGTLKKILKESALHGRTNRPCFKELLKWRLCYLQGTSVIVPDSLCRHHIYILVGERGKAQKRSYVSVDYSFIEKKLVSVKMRRHSAFLQV